ncbi:sugar ABC transporter substrate-binding protein [Streptomyces sp. NPDC056716]|uniref:sugar ABC transporter substrate-binding protein n=1 Tax=unclassified Streptomyces TaxID=2593676 RepID=UPI00368E93FF
MGSEPHHRRGGSGRRPRAPRSLAFLAGSLAAGMLLTACGGSTDSGSAASGDGEGDIGPGIAAPKDLKPFEFGQPAGEKPDLPKRIAWANTSDAEFFLQITNSIELAAKERGLEFVTAIANDDSAKNIEQIETFLQRGVGALCIQPLDANAQAPLMQRAIESGAAVMSLVTPPSTVQAVADQYKVGQAQGLAAAKYITEELDGKAKVVYFNNDTIEVLKARHQGVLDGLRTAGDGVEIVADVQPPAITQEGGFKALSTVLQKEPDIDVILGGDTHVLGALSALESAKAVKPHMYLSGIDGDEQALAEVGEKGVYRASFAFAYPLMGYAWAQFAADWLEGKPVPQVMQFNAIELNSPETIAAYKADMKDVATTWKNAETYFTLLGSVDYEHRDQYINDAA